MAGCRMICWDQVSTSATTETQFHRQIRAGLGVIGGDHRIIRRQAPFGAVLVGRQAKRRHQMALQHFAPLAVFKADDVIGCDGLLDRHGGLEISGGFSRRR